MKFAAIDIGSNAARLQISSVLEDEGVISFKRVEYVRFALRLGHDVFIDGAISPESEVRIFKLFPSTIFLYNSLWFDDEEANTILITGAVELKKPNTRMKIIGNKKLNITADGLLKIERKLALAMAIIAVN